MRTMTQLFLNRYLAVIKTARENSCRAYKKANVNQYIRSHSNIGYIGPLLLVINLLNGCASDTPKISPQHRIVSSHAKNHNRLRHFSHSNKQAFNRPYRIKGKTYYPMTSAAGYSETGIASWYGSESGSKTSMGTHFSPQALSAAHKTLPLPSRVRVTNLHNGRSVVLTVNDRGPFKPNRIIDLSHGAAKTIGLHGLARVKVDYLGSAD
ncbi:MAG: septal ring lytic transglycosylase RlpA family protein [Methylococcales bacterium]